MNEFNLDQYQAFKLMLDGKMVINEKDFIYKINKERNLIETNANTIEDYSEFLKMQPYKFKEYIDPKITLLEELNELKKYSCEGGILREIAHLEAENLLLKYINNQSVTKAFRAIDHY